MKKKSVKNFISFLLCVCFLTFAGCSGNEPVDSDSDSTSPSSSGNVSDVPEAEPTTLQPQKISDDDKLVALTFDDGPYSPVTERILDTLEANGAKATFFVVGDRVGKYEKTVKRAQELGCEIGSHTWSHKNLTKLTASGIVSEIDKSNDAISKVTGNEISVVRPPEGAVNDSVRSNVKYPLIMWSVDSMDWKNRDAEKDYKEVMEHVFDGSIVLMHDLYPETADAVEKFIPELIKQGYRFVTVSELMKHRGVECESGIKYYSAKPKPKPTEQSQENS